MFDLLYCRVMMTLEGHNLGVRFIPIRLAGL
jgi:hypothetical protein